MFKTYYRLTKPGIVYGNALVATAGFMLASQGHVDFRLFIAMLVGLSLIIAASCVFNNILDRGIDAKMVRTKKRALVSGQVRPLEAFIYASLLGLAGAVLLGARTNLLTLCISLFGALAYIVLYGIGKRRSVHGTLVGSISGAVPPVVGYVAVTDRLDGAAVLLFVILAIWQMPHFYAIAMYRRDDYAAAGLPVLPVKKTMGNAKVQIILYVAAFIVAAALMTAYGYTGYSYLAVMLVAGGAWLLVGLRGFGSIDDAVWAKKMFFYSLIIIVVLSVMWSVGAILP